MGHNGGASLFLAVPRKASSFFWHICSMIFDQMGRSEMGRSATIRFMHTVDLEQHVGLTLYVCMSRCFVGCVLIQLNANEGQSGEFGPQPW